MALLAAHAPLLPLSEERPDPVGCSPGPASLAWTVGKPWVRTRLHLGLGKEGGGAPATCQAMPSCPSLLPLLLTQVKSCPPRSPWGRQCVPGPWGCWDWLMVVLALLWGAAGGWAVFWSTALSLELCTSGMLLGVGSSPMQTQGSPLAVPCALGSISALPSALFQ